MFFIQLIILMKKMDMQSILMFLLLLIGGLLMNWQRIMMPVGFLLYICISILKIENFIWDRCGILT